jgi:hypothetical protein
MQAVPSGELKRLKPLADQGQLTRVETGFSVSTFDAADGSDERLGFRAG